MKVLTLNDLIEILQLSEKQAKALIRDKGFPSIKIGREYRVSEESLYRWLQENEHKKIKLDYSKL